jgi:hypothetical protein
MNNGKPAIPAILGKTDFGRIEQLLRFQNFIIAGKTAKIAAPGDGDGIGKSRHFMLLLVFDGGHLLRSDESVRHFRNALNALSEY